MYFVADINQIIFKNILIIITAKPFTLAKLTDKKQKKPQLLRTRKKGADSHLLGFTWMVFLPSSSSLTWGKSMNQGEMIDGHMVASETHAQIRCNHDLPTRLVPHALYLQNPYYVDQCNLYTFSFSFPPFRELESYICNEHLVRVNKYTGTVQTSEAPQCIWQIWPPQS